LDTNGYSPRFIYYLLQTLYRTGYMAVFNIQHTGVSRFQYTSFKTHTELRIPELPIQRKIAAILSAYDELIESNKRRIALLEKLAEEIYREWFVRFRFPGHDKVKIIKGVPHGWQVRTLGSFANEIKKGVKKKDLVDDEKYLGLEHIPRRSIAIKEWATADTVESNKLLFHERDILFGKIRPYLHKVALAHFSGACSSDTIVIRPKEKLYEGYLLFTVFSDTFVELATVASKGTKMPRADWSFLKKLEFAVPDTSLLEIYQSQFDALFSQIVNLLRSNEVLATSRHRLLPRLISGKVSVENLDIQFSPSMAEELDAQPTAAHA
jgi:type I restriction enzyme, S subunit